MREVHFVAVGDEHEEREQVQDEEREDDVEGWKVWDHADLHGRVDEGEEDPTGEDGDQDEEGGEMKAVLICDFTGMAGKTDGMIQ